MKQTAPLSDHQYDGIQEYDNPTPGWWHAIFYATVLFSLGYFVIYQLDPDATTIQQLWEEDRAADLKRVFAKRGELKRDEATMLSLMGDEPMMAVARGMFKTNCVSCHGPEGGGVVGVNLTDDSYKNIKKLTDLPRVIAEGAAAGAMPSWKRLYSENEIVLLGAYIASLRGKNVPGRGPEGEKIDPWPVAPAAPPK